MNISTLSQAYNPNKWATVPYNNLKHIYLSDQRPNFKWPNASNVAALSYACLKMLFAVAYAHQILHFDSVFSLTLLFLYLTNFWHSLSNLVFERLQ